MNGMVVESIVQIDEVPERRRQLKGESKDDVVGEDYMVKA